MFAIKAVGFGAEDGRVALRPAVEDGVRVVRGRGFALGAGDADDEHLALRVAIEPRRQQRHGLADVGDDNAPRAGRLVVRRFGDVAAQAAGVGRPQVFALERALAEQQG